MYTHTSNTNLYSNNLKSDFCIRWHFNSNSNLVAKQNAELLFECEVKEVKINRIYNFNI